MAEIIAIAISDENFSGKVLNQVSVQFSSRIVSVRDVIEARVRNEVEAYNKKLPEYYNGLIQPTDAEKTINGYKLGSKKPIDVEKQIYVALDAFQKNGFFVLIDSHQFSSLDDMITLTGESKISFVKLTPLVGG